MACSALSDDCCSCEARRGRGREGGDGEGAGEVCGRGGCGGWVEEGVACEWCGGVLGGGVNGGVRTCCIATLTSSTESHTMPTRNSLPTPFTVACARVRALDLAVPHTFFYTVSLPISYTSFCTVSDTVSLTVPFTVSKTVPYTVLYTVSSANLLHRNL